METNYGGGAAIARFDLAFDGRGFTTTAKQSGSAFDDYYANQTYSSVFNAYAYNARGELETSAMYRKTPPATGPAPAGDELPARRFEYRYDSMGNRTTSGPADPAGANAAANDDYTVTGPVNQYASRENNTVKVLGTVASGATVAVAYTTTTKLDRSFGAEFVPPNTAGVVKGNTTTYSYASATSTLGSVTKPYLVPPALQSFGYDADGNLTSDGVWKYSYDAENRLVAMENLSTAIGAGRIASADARKLVFAYDYAGRRVRKTAYGGWNGTTYGGTAVTDVKFIYDGWNMVAEFNAISGLVIARVYTWGLDVSGSLANTGGVGALLRMTNYSSGSPGTSYDPAYDGNGNVVALVTSSGTGAGSLAAAYEYDPYGDSLRAQVIDVAVTDAPFRFSTKYTDVETGLAYYGLRYYDAKSGRFINRDPIQERGGANLYGFVGNNPVNRLDYLGLDQMEVCTNTETWECPTSWYCVLKSRRKCVWVDIVDSRNTPTSQPPGGTGTVTGNETRAPNKEEEKKKELPPCSELRKQLMKEILPSSSGAGAALAGSGSYFRGNWRGLSESLTWVFGTPEESAAVWDASGQVDFFAHMYAMSPDFRSSVNDIAITYASQNWETMAGRVGTGVGVSLGLNKGLGWGKGGSVLGTLLSVNASLGDARYMIRNGVHPVMAMAASMVDGQLDPAKFGAAAAAVLNDNDKLMQLTGTECDASK